MLEIIKKKLVPEVSNLHRWVETLVITLVIFGLCFSFNPGDPFFLKGTFSWIWMAPILIALRYGMWFSLVSIGLLIAGFFLLEPKAILETTTYRYSLFGGILITMICAEFQSAWYNAVLRAQQLNAYARERMDILSKAYYALKISHDRLQVNVVARPITLSGVFEKLDKMLIEESGDITADLALRFIHLLSQYCAMQKAGLYLVEGQALSKTPIAVLGEMGELNRDDVLVKLCLKNIETNYFAVNQLDEKSESQYAVVAPLRNSNDELLGVLVVEKMSFWSLNKDILQILSALLAYFSDQAWAIKTAAQLLKEYPDCPPQFARALYKFRRVKINEKIESALFVFSIDNTVVNYGQIIDWINLRSRTIDFLWFHAMPDRTVVFVLKPFYLPDTLKWALYDFQKYLKSQYAAYVASDQLFLNAVQLPGDDPLELIRRWIARENAT
jgi:hypothetical protein